MASVICYACGNAFDPPAGHTRTKVQCPACGVICAVPEGAKRRPAPAGKAAPAKKSAEEDWFKEEPKLVAKEVPDEAEVDETVPVMELDDDPPEDEDDDPRPYELRDKLGPRCRECRAELPPGAEACVKCGYNRKTRRKTERAYEPIARKWESDRPLAERLMWLGAAQAFHAFLGLITYWGFGTYMPAVLAWFPMTALLCFLLGTYDTITLTRDAKGRVRVTKLWRFAFVPLAPVTVDVRGYEGVVSGPWLNSGLLDWFVMFTLLGWGVLPGFIWYWMAIHTPQFLVALAEDHGVEGFYVYRGRNQDQMNEIADAICAASGLRRLG